MLQKFLLIGVGGSGGKTLRYTWRELDRRLDGAQWKGGVPAAWQFLHIDVAELPDVVEGDVPADIGPDAKYVGLARQPLKYGSYDEDLVSRDVLKSVAGWRPDPMLKIPEPWKGAGQRRAVGRIITLTRLDKIGAAIQNAVTALSNTEVEKELASLNRHLKLTAPTTNSEAATAVVVSSLAGGSGSGMFLDVIELLKARATARQEWLDTSLVTVLFAPDVFDSVPEVLRSGVDANSLAAIAELLNAFEHQGDRSALEGELLSGGGGTLPVRGRRTGRTNFIIGAGNGQVAFENTWDVYRAAGKGLATFVASEAVQAPFQTYIGPNSPGLITKPSFTLSEADDLERPCSSFGYSNVSLGRSLFSRYAEERFAKLALNRLLRGHRAEFSDAGQLRDETMIADLVEREHAWFFDATGLYERSLTHNQVLDALRKVPQTKAKLDKVVDDVRAELRSNKSKRDVGAWLKSFKDLFDAKALDFEVAERTLRHHKAQRWVIDVQRQTCDATAVAASRLGLPVTIALLEALGDQVEEAASELERAKVQFSQQEEDLLDRAVSFFRTVRDKVINTSHSSFDAATGARREALQRRTEAELYGFTASLLRDISEGFLPPLRGALRKGQADLATAAEQQDEKLVAQWSPDVVPPHLKAAPNEVLLDDEETFPGELERLLEIEFEGAGRDGAISAAIQEVITGAWPSIREADTPGKRPLIRQTREWRPTSSAARTPSASASAALIEIDVTPRALLSASAAWVRHRDGMISEHVKGSLSVWLAKSHRDSADRASRFADALRQAVGYAAPLVKINAETHRLVHGDQQQPMLVVSAIPLDQGHGASRRVVETLTAAGLADSQVTGLFDPTSGASQVEISSFIAAAVHPVVFGSLTVPIQQHWQAASGDAAARRRFWQARRARPLTSFVPLSPTRQRALARGWLTATLLGHVDVLDGPWSENPLSIWTTRGRLTFPRFLLGKEVTRDGAVLPALMESLPLALLTFSSGETGELGAYMRLLALGAAGSGAMAPYDDCNAELATWIKTGAQPAAEDGYERAPVPPAQEAGLADQSPEERREALAATLTTYQEAFRSGIVGIQITDETSLTVPRAWEIRDLMQQAIKDLLAAINGINLAPRSAPGRLSVSARE